MFFLAAEVANLQRSDKKFDLIFRPSSKAALATAEMSEIYGGEIVLKDFAVNRNASNGGSEPAESEPASEPKTEPIPASNP